MQLLIDALSAVMALTAGSLVAANVFVIVATLLHRRRFAMRFLSHFTRAVTLLRLSDTFGASRPYRHR